MSVSRAMRRLAQVLEMQEERSRAAMESVRAEIRQLGASMARDGERERDGRESVRAGVASGELSQRIAGLEESRLARRHSAVVAERIAQTESMLESVRREFLRRRIERRQTQTLIDEAGARARVEAERRTQRDLDDWFLGWRGAPGDEPGSRDGGRRS